VSPVERLSTLADSGKSATDWITPLILYTELNPEQMIFLFEARPADASLVPDEVVPNALLRALKALADPTRLKIIHT
jgi:hypothetical protein